MQWQPIDTAPKDQILDIFGDGGRYTNCIWKRPSSGKGKDCCWCYEECVWWYVPVPSPAYWMEIDPPEQDSKNDK